MAKLSALPDIATISKLKGVVDFYLWKGIPCARKWPHWPKRYPYPLEKANQDVFAYAVHTYNILPEYIKEQYRAMTAGTKWAGRDLFMRAYLRGIRYGEPQ